MPTTALIVAAGAGLRMGLSPPKAFLDLAGRPIVDYSLAVFDAHPRIDAILLMSPASMLGEAARIASAYGKVKDVLAGGQRRQDTVKRGVEHVAFLAAGGRDDTLVLIHDAARPLIEADIVTSVIDAAARTGAAFPGVAPADTVREIGGAPAPRLAGRTLDRGGLVLVQTPQGFRLGVILDALARAGDAEVTDDAALAQRAGHAVEVVQGSPRNLKITAPGDLEIAAALLAQQGGGRRPGPQGR